MKHVHSGSGEIPWRPGDEDCGCGVSGASRREFLKSVAAVSAGALLPATSLPGLLAQVASPAARALSGRIDVHHHVVPPALLQALGAGGGAGGQSTWTPAKALEQMDQGGVSTGMSSIAPAGDPFNNPATAVRLTRECNEYTARLAVDHPGRFGLMAALPLPNIDASLKEIDTPSIPSRRTASACSPFTARSGWAIRSSIRCSRS